MDLANTKQSLVKARKMEEKAHKCNEMLKLAVKACKANLVVCNEELRKCKAELGARDEMKLQLHSFKEVTNDLAQVKIGIDEVKRMDKVQNDIDLCILM